MKTYWTKQAKQFLFASLWVFTASTSYVLSLDVNKNLMTKVETKIHQYKFQKASSDTLTSNEDKNSKKSVISKSK